MTTDAIARSYWKTRGWRHCGRGVSWQHGVVGARRGLVVGWVARQQQYAICHHVSGHNGLWRSRCRRAVSSSPQDSLKYPQWKADLASGCAASTTTRREKRRFGDFPLVCGRWFISTSVVGASRSRSRSRNETSRWINRRDYRATHPRGSLPIPRVQFLVLTHVLRTYRCWRRVAHYYRSSRRRPEIHRRHLGSTRRRWLFPHPPSLDFWIVLFHICQKFYLDISLKDVPLLTSRGLFLPLLVRARVHVILIGCRYTANCSYGHVENAPNYITSRRDACHATPPSVRRVPRSANSREFNFSFPSTIIMFVYRRSNEPSSAQMRATRYTPGSMNDWQDGSRWLSGQISLFKMFNHAFPSVIYSPSIIFS